jgi:hypothetical protein
MNRADWIGGKILSCDDCAFAPLACSLANTAVVAAAGVDALLWTSPGTCISIISPPLSAPTSGTIIHPQGTSSSRAWPSLDCAKYSPIVARVHCWGRACCRINLVFSALRYASLAIAGSYRPFHFLLNPHPEG